MTSKHIITKVSFKITIRERHFYIDIRWLWIWNQYLYIWIWNDDRSTIIVLPSFQLVTRLNSQNRNENVFINEYCHINLYMNILSPNGIIEVSTTRIWSFFTLFQFLTRLKTSKYLKVHISAGEMERREKRAFQLLKMPKKKISWNIKTKCVTDFLFTGPRVWRIILVITGWALKKQTFTLISIKIMRIWKFFVYI